MSSLGVALKRKSVEKVQPTLPKPKKQRESSREGRTVYYQLQPPSEELKEFRKKQLYTIGHLSTEKSDTNITSQELPMKQSRFDDDHHNTQSIAQLLNSKMGSNFPTVRTKLSKESIDKSQEKINSYKDSLQSDSLAVKDSIGSKERQEGSYQALGDSREGQNYDDYVLGDKVDEEEESTMGRGSNNKKYVNDHNPKPLGGYSAKSASQLRAQQIHINNERKKLLQMHEDQQIISIMQQYKNNRQSLMNQSKKKHETARMLASLPKPEAKIQKSTSLPALKPKQEVILPEVYQGNQVKRNVIAKDFDQRKQNQYIQRRLKQSLSYAKLGFGRKRVRTICEEELYEEEMSTVEEIRSKLKAKGINLDANKLARGMVNQKNIVNYQGIIGYPQPRLPSNPIYKKFPL